MRHPNFATAILRIIPFTVLALASTARADYFAVSNDTVNSIGAIVRTDDVGNVVGSFGQGVLTYPISLVFDKQGVLYVGDYAQGKVHRFLPNGTYLGEFARVTDTISSVLFHPDGSLLVTRYDGGDVWRFAADGTPMPDFVSGNGLSRQGQMAFDAAGNLYICSWTDNTILYYDIDGNPLGTFSDTAKSGITGVTGMAFDANGQMYVSEYTSNRIRLLDANGFFVTEVATTFGEIEYLTLGDDGNLFVPYFYDHTIHRFMPDGTDLGEFAPVMGTYQIEKGPLSFLPDGFTAVRGRVDSGNVASLGYQDGDALRTCRFIVLNSSEPPVQVNVKATVTVADASALTVFVTSKMVSNGLFAQEVVMFDENGVQSPTVRRTDSLNQNTKTVSLSANVPANFIAADGSVRIRYNVKAVGPTAGPNWCQEVDQVSWVVVP